MENKQQTPERDTNINFKTPQWEIQLNKMYVMYVWYAPAFLLKKKIYRYRIAY